MKNRILILSVLHNLHEEHDYYSLEVLKKVVEQIAPDVICVELSPEGIKTDDLQKTASYKTEYKVILPYAEAHGCELVALEPAQPLFSKLVDPYKQAQKHFEENEPKKDEALDQFIGILYENLFDYWDSVFTVNSAKTDFAFKIKHAFQSAIVGDGERDGWEAWNQHFLKQILAANQQHEGKLILVTVGAEHRYWLTDALEKEENLQLVDLTEVVDDKS